MYDRCICLPLYTFMSKAARREDICAWIVLHVYYYASNDAL